VSGAGIARRGVRTLDEVRDLARVLYPHAAGREHWLHFACDRVLQGALLEHRLDDQVAAVQRGDVRRGRDACQRRVARLWRRRTAREAFVEQLATFALRRVMTIDDAVDLVLYAFEHGNNGDLFVQKAPASTVGDLAQALKEQFQAVNPVPEIGVRLGEKIHETLLTREESATAVDMGDFFRVPADVGGLNYAKYFSDGNRTFGSMMEYTSSNTHQLNAQELKEKLLRCEYVAEELRQWNEK